MEATTDNKTGLLIDLKKSAIYVNGKELHLPQLQFKIMVLLATNLGCVVKIDTILEHLYGPDHATLKPHKYVINTFITKIRKQIYEAGGDDSCIETIFARGYRLNKV